MSTGQAFPCFRLARLYHDDDDDDDEDDDDDVENDDNDGHHEVQAKSDRLIRIHIYTYRERETAIYIIIHSAAFCRSNRLRAVKLALCFSGVVPL